MHLDVSGTKFLSWSDVFDCAASLTQLQHLGMRNLEFLHTYEHHLCQPVFQTAWVERFFDRVETLTSLDVSFVKLSWFTPSLSNALTLAMDTIVSSAKSLSFLMTCSWFSNEVLRDLYVRRDVIKTSFFLLSEIPLDYSTALPDQCVVLPLLGHQRTSDAQVIISKGLSFLKGNALVYVLDSILRSLSSQSQGNYSIFFKRVLERAVFAVQCYISTDIVNADEPLSSLMRKVFSFKAKLKDQGYWQEADQVWGMFLEALLHPHFFRHDFFLLCLFEELIVIPKPSLMHASTVLLVNMLLSKGWVYEYYDRCSLNRIELIVQTFLNSLSKEQKTGFVLVNIWTFTLARSLRQFIDDAKESHRSSLFRPRKYCVFLNVELCVRFNVLRLMSSGIPVLQKQLVDNDAVSSYVQEFLFYDVPYFAMAKESFLKFLISLAETSQLRGSFVTPPLLGLLSRKAKKLNVRLSRSYLSCLLLLSRTFSSQLNQMCGLSEKEFACQAVHYSRRQFSETAMNYVQRHFSVASLKEMSQFNVTEVAYFGQQCLAIVEQ